MIASADETVRVISFNAGEYTAKSTKPPGSIKHPVAVRAILPLLLTDLSEPYLITAAGDVLRTFDVSSLQEPECLSEIDGHWHDITYIGLWMRKSEGDDGRKRVEPWIVTTGLDRTIRKWKLTGMVVNIWSG
jgi:WD40 repeat protein